MFNNLKNKIQKETGQDPLTLPATTTYRNRMSLSSQNSLSIDELSKLEEVRDKTSENILTHFFSDCWLFLTMYVRFSPWIQQQKDAEINSLKSELLKARSHIESLLDEKRYLEHSAKSSQVQHELSHEENDKIQNAQFHEITNLRQQMKFREQVRAIYFLQNFVQSWYERVYDRFRSRSTSSTRANRIRN